MHNSRRNPRRCAAGGRGPDRAQPHGGASVFDVEFDTDTPPARWPSISVCLIVKDEAGNLGPCLASLGDLACQIVVVDTGSTDDTVAIAQAHGAEVYHFPWIGDFAAARNESIAHARGSWIFWLDADDRLDPAAVTHLKQAAACGLADAYACIVVSAMPDGGYETSDHIRLFRRGLGIAFTGAIHETPWTKIVERRLRVGQANITIRHTGYLSPQLTAQKSRRNLELIDGQLALHPESLELLFYRGQARGQSGDPGGMQADLRTYLERTQPTRKYNHMRFWSYASLASFADAAAAADTLELLRRALAEMPGQPFLLKTLGSLHLTLSEPEQAVAAYLGAYVGTNGVTRGLVPPPGEIELLLAEAYSAWGKPEEAVCWAEKAYDRDPAHPGNTLTLARYYREARRPADAERLALGLAPSAAQPEPWLVLAELYAESGRWAKAAGAIEMARGCGLPVEQAEDFHVKLQAAHIQSDAGQNGCAGAEAEARYGALQMLARGEHLRAAECFAGAIAGNPTDPDNYRYLALALQRMGQHEQAMEAWRLAEHWRTAVGPT